AYIPPRQDLTERRLHPSSTSQFLEWLPPYHWDDLDHVQRFATDWMWTYNHDRPNMALGGFTPKQRLAMAA
ncbi:integrase core domain-containing protein, partial [Burkholderia thailandensis]|uniref:integrase core domain-containing protein n=1 Tax=Burkholderia thailandensis TaxID=57975 RepID=UPI002155F100